MPTISWAFPPTADDGTAIRDLALDNTGDLFVTNGDIQTVHVGPAAAAQGVQIRTNFFMGDWFRDLTLGMPYWQRIFVKNPSLVEVKQWYTIAITSAPDVMSLTTLNLNYDNGSRRLTVNFQAKATNNQNLSGVGSTGS